MLIRNVYIENATTPTDVRIVDGVFAEIAPQLVASEGEQIIEGNTNLMLPPYVEPHVHLDACLTAGTPRWNESGTLFEGVQIFSEYKQLNLLSPEDVKRRATAAFACLPRMACNMCAGMWT